MNIKDDSRKINKGDIFVALKKEHDGHDYVLDAIKAGASEVVVEHGLYSVKTTVVNNTHEYLVNYLKENYYDEIKDLKLIGMTGTNGKTTTCFLIYQALNNLNIKTAYIGTIGFYIDSKVCDLPNTTPDICDIYEMLLECKKQNCKYVVMETSSHALDMDRLKGLSFDVGIFSNLTKDHMDYHKTFENYALAKQKLFKMVKYLSIVNSDSEYKDYFISSNTTTYGINSGDYKVSDYKITMGGNEFVVNDVLYKTKLIGKHNIYNTLIVIVLLEYLGFNSDVIKEVISNLSAPRGRMEMIKKDNNLIIIDYAHTPDAVFNIINSCIELKPNNIITIVGCGGNRDKAKRPIMANIACSLSNHVIMTSDNPRDEDAMQIIDDMIQGLDKTNYEIEVNREKAIIKGIQKLKNNDILLVLGKGHETYQIINGKKNDFDDKLIVLNNI